ncbi:TPA: hypothetical protein PN979_004819 [Escherichia coli]|nr:hypothetical protein [Escherichia coli]EJK1708402.1 hypothetical protein [Escherichia coli]HAW1538869.1 hypothetical protein [Escherichia coli]HBB2006193.1 hypothetical protein [Escherichia coli]HCO5732520.1 hypothetical protein [Escherichia coli]
MIQFNLKPGCVEKQHFFLLLSLTSITSENLKSALEHYFVLGESQRDVCKRFNVNISYFSLKVALIQDVNRRVVSMYPFYNQLYKETSG